MKKTIEGYERNGLNLTPEKRERLTAVKSRISELCIQYQQNLNENVDKIAFTGEELEGVGDSFLESLPKTEDGKYYVSLKYPELFPVLQKAVREETRKTMSILSASECMVENTPIFEEIIQLRKEEAELLGYTDHAHYILAVKMAKNSENVFNFLTDLTQKLQKHLEEELLVLLNLKKKEKEEREEEYDGKINLWDYRYYNRLLLEKEYSVDQDAIRPYFPIERVTEGLLTVYQDILNLTFKVTENPHVWHPDVIQYDVHDRTTEEFMGHFYLDLYPREGKYGHAAEFNLMNTCEYKGEKLCTASAMVANFTKPTQDKPSLLEHDEVETYFHEFGHVMHEICSNSKYIQFSGTRGVQSDFIEAPSQMLENWCYEESVLRILSGHYQTNEPLPKKMIDDLIKAKNVNAALQNRRQLFFGTFDMILHTTPPPVNTQELWARLQKEVACIEAPPNTNGAASFGHMVGGYSAGYYGYLWSKVYSSDMYMRFKEAEGPLDQTVGQRYRTMILQPGGSFDAMDILINFLGREPIQEPFLIELGLIKKDKI